MPQLYEVVLPTDRWSVRAISPIDIRDGVDDSMGHPVVIHPGWGKAPERHTELMLDLTEAGYLPIGVDTRYGYSNRQLQPATRFRVLTQPYSVGIDNPYFENSDSAANRWQYRRPTSLLHMCERLNIVERSYIGHSEGGRVVSLGALATPQVTRQAIIVNGAGTGDSSNGLRRLVRSNANRIKELAHEKQSTGMALRSALGSVAYTATHARRTLREKSVIQSTNLWLTIDALHAHGIPTTVFHAVGDEMIAFEDSARQAATRPWLNFTPTEGSHSNIYTQGVRQALVSALRAH